MNVDIQSSTLNELFVLYPVIVQGWVTPVKPDGIAHGGIPKALYDGQPQGLECLVDPWREPQLRNLTMAADDRVDLYVNDNPTPVAGKTVLPGEEQQRIRLYLPHGNLNQGVNRLYYVVTRVGGNADTSLDLFVLYHLRIAEGLDLVIPADVLRDGVSADRAAQGVEFGFSYNNRRNFDRIEFLLGDTTIRFDVPEGSAPITHTLFTDDFQKAGDNPSAVAEFYVIDQLGNRSKSPEKRLDIHLGAVTHPVPRLTSVMDATDIEIPQAGQTFSTALTLKGTASKDQQVEIFDGSGSSAVSKGKANANAITGEWVLPITVPEGARRLYAKALYPVSPVYSNVRTLTVITLLVPTITKATGSPSGNEIVKDGFTPETSIVLEGRASQNQRVQLFNGASPIGPEVPVETNGSWSRLLSGLDMTRHVFSAQALYGDRIKSDPFALTVVERLVVEPSEMKLDGVKWVQNYGWPTRDVPGNTATRTVQGGARPYNYQSLDTTTATVDSNGKVTGLKNGRTQIRVTDGTLQAVTYDVHVSNVSRVEYANFTGAVRDGIQWITSVGGSVQFNTTTYFANLVANFNGPIPVRPVIGLANETQAWELLYAFNEYVTYPVDLDFQNPNFIAMAIIPT